MREAFFILLVVAVLLALTALRYRRQLTAAYQFWRLIRSAQNNVRGEMREPLESAKGSLVNCAKCGMWVPESNAIKIGGRIFYCSATCVEKAASSV